MGRYLSIFSITLLLVCTYSPGDTFTSRSGSTVYHGYATSQTDDLERSAVHTTEKGLIYLNLAEYKIELNLFGRSKKVAILSIPDSIESYIETEALIKALTEEADKGPPFVVIEIDTPGGNIEYCQKICAAISETRYCQTVAFINGGDDGGAYSAGAVVALACDKIFMSKGTVIGAATAIVGVKSLKEYYGENVGEKFDSAWRNYIATLAQQGGRSGLLGKAMADKDVEVIEVVDKGKRCFIESVNKKPGQKVVHTWSQKGQLLTLPAKNAVECLMADGIASSRHELVMALGVSSADVVINTKPAEARAEFSKAGKRFEKLITSIDLYYNEATTPMRRGRHVKSIKRLMLKFKQAIKLAELYPGLNINKGKLQEGYNDVKAHYESVR